MPGFAYFGTEYSFEVRQADGTHVFVYVLSTFPNPGRLKANWLSPPMVSFDRLYFGPRVKHEHAPHRSLHP